MYSLSHNHSLQSDPISQLATGTFIIASLIITPIAFYTKHRHTNKTPTQDYRGPAQRNATNISTCNASWGLSTEKCTKHFYGQRKLGGASAQRNAQAFLRTTQAGWAHHYETLRDSTDNVNRDNNIKHHNKETSK